MFCGLLCRLDAEDDGWVDIELAAQLPADFQRRLALAVENLADTGVAETEHLGQLCLREPHLVEAQFDDVNQRRLANGIMDVLVLLYHV